MKAKNAEEWIAQFDAAIAKGRGSTEAADRAAAIAELKSLGITDGDCEYWITRKR